MQIPPSAFSSGLSAVQGGLNRVAEAGSDIARNSLPARENQAAPPAEPDLATSLVELKMGEREAAAGARVLETADQVLGTLVDIRA